MTMTRPPYIEQTDDGLDDIFGALQPALHDSHVWLFHGFDLTASTILDYQIAPCPFVKNPVANGNEVCILTHEDLGWRQIFIVCCGDCGARGPWGKTESEALELWNTKAGALQ